MKCFRRPLALLARAWPMMPPTWALDLSCRMEVLFLNTIHLLTDVRIAGRRPDSSTPDGRREGGAERTADLWWRFWLVCVYWT